MEAPFTGDILCAIVPTHKNYRARVIGGSGAQLSFPLRASTKTPGILKTVIFEDENLEANAAIVTLEDADVINLEFLRRSSDVGKFLILNFLKKLPLFKNRTFMLNEMTKGNASKFAIF